MSTAIQSTYVKISDRFHGMTTCADGVGIGVASGRSYTHADVKQRVISLIFANHQRRVIALGSVGMMNNSTRRQRFAKCPLGFEPIDLIFDASDFGMTVVTNRWLESADAMPLQETLRPSDDPSKFALVVPTDVGSLSAPALTEANWDRILVSHVAPPPVRLDVMRRWAGVATGSASLHFISHLARAST